MMNNEHRHDISQVANEEAIMEAEDVLESMIDEAVKTEFPYWYNSEAHFFEYFMDLIHENPGVVRSIFLNMRSKDVPALKPLDESYEAWCEGMCREGVKSRLGIGP